MTTEVVADDAAIIADCLRRYRRHIRDTEEARRRSPESVEPFRLRIFDEITASRDPTEPGEEVMEDPVRAGLLGVVRDLGWQYFVAGGTVLMKKLADEVEALMTDAPAFAGSTIDSWWDGIGNSKDAWYA